MVFNSLGKKTSARNFNATVDMWLDIYFKSKPPNAGWHEKSFLNYLHGLLTSVYIWASHHLGQMGITDIFVYSHVFIVNNCTDYYPQVFNNFKNENQLAKFFFPYKYWCLLVLTYPMLYSKDLLQLSIAMCLRKKVIFKGEQMHVRIWSNSPSISPVCICRLRFFHLCVILGRKLWLNTCTVCHV